MHISCLRVSKLPPCWYQNLTNASPLYSPDFYRFFCMEVIKRPNPYGTFVLYSCFWKRVAKQPNTQTTITALRRFSVFKNSLIGTTSKGLDIQWLSLRLIWPDYQLLSIESHQGEIIHIHLVSWGHNLEYFIRLEHFGLSCVCPLHCLGNSADGVQPNMSTFIRALSFECTTKL